MSSSSPTTDELRQLLHNLRDPLGAMVIRLSLLDDAHSSAEEREHVAAMLASVERMIKAIADITTAFHLEEGCSTPLAILTGDRRMYRVQPSSGRRQAERSR